MYLFKEKLYKGKFIVKCLYIKKRKKVSNLSFCLEKLEKEAS